MPERMQGLQNSGGFLLAYGAGIPVVRVVIAMLFASPSSIFFATAISRHHKALSMLEKYGDFVYCCVFSLTRG